MSVPFNQESEAMIELQDLNIKLDEEQKQQQTDVINQNNQNKGQKAINNNNSNNNPPPNRANNPRNNNTHPQQPANKANKPNQTQNNNTMPSIAVTCKFCTLDQKIAGNAQLFVCAACQNMNECTPKYNVFVCCKCRRNVTYPLGVSNLIKCNACATVNKVPISIGQQTNQNYQQYPPQQPVIIRVPQNAQTNVRINNTNRNTNSYQNSYPYQQPSYQQPSYQQPNNYNNNYAPQPKQQEQVWQNYEDFFKNQPKQQQQNLQAGQFFFQEPQKQQQYPDLESLTIVNQNKDGVSSEKVILNGQTIVNNNSSI